MWDSLAKGYKLALVTLVIEMVVSLALLSNAFGIFAILAMPFIGIAWLPVALLILSDIRQEPGPGLRGYILATACAVVGIACAVLCFRWIVLAGFAR